MNTRCTGGRCPLRFSCHRYVGKDERPRRFFMQPPYDVFDCDYFEPVEPGTTRKRMETT